MSFTILLKAGISYCQGWISVTQSKLLKCLLKIVLALIQKSVLSHRGFFVSSLFSPSHWVDWPHGLSFLTHYTRHQNHQQLGLSQCLSHVRPLKCTQMDPSRIEVNNFFEPGQIFECINPAYSESKHSHQQRALPKIAWTSKAWLFPSTASHALHKSFHNNNF